MMLYILNAKAPQQQTTPGLSVSPEVDWVRCTIAQFRTYNAQALMPINGSAYRSKALEHRPPPMLSLNYFN